MLANHKDWGSCKYISWAGIVVAGVEGGLAHNVRIFFKEEAVGVVLATLGQKPF